MNWLQVGVQWLHVLLGIAWFGYALSMYFLVSPPLFKLPEDQQRDIFARLGAVGPKVFPIVATLVLVLGFVRGTFLGRIKGFDDLATTYGVLLTIGLLGTLALFFTGARFIGPAFESIGTAPDFQVAKARILSATRIDLGIFLVVFTCMILMRFN